MTNWKLALALACSLLLCGGAAHAACPDSPEPEVCDDIDNDCDGFVDEYEVPVSRTCGVDIIDSNAATDATETRLGAGTPADCSLTVNQPGEILDFNVRASISHPDPSQLAIELITPDGESIDADLDDRDGAKRITEVCLGDRLRPGVVMHGGFYLGPGAMYEALKNMDEAERERICMTGIAFVNQLYGHEALATAQRRHARFMNTTMMVTLLGGACSDALETGQVVSGVGGQYNFVAMGHALEGARSILMLRSTRSKAGQVTSNLVWSYGHVTIPRHQYKNLDARMELSGLFGAGRTPGPAAGHGGAPAHRRATTAEGLPPLLRTLKT